MPDHAVWCAPFSWRDDRVARGIGELTSVDESLDLFFQLPCLRFIKPESLRNLPRLDRTITWSEDMFEKQLLKFVFIHCLVSP